MRKNIYKKIISLLRWIIKKILVYIWYVNILIVLAVAIWSAWFIKNYVISFEKDFAFIKDNITNISYIKLQEKEFDSVYKKYQDKLNQEIKIPDDLESPFK